MNANQDLFPEDNSTLLDRYGIQWIHFVQAPEGNSRSPQDMGRTCLFLMSW